MAIIFKSNLLKENFGISIQTLLPFAPKDHAADDLMMPLTLKSHIVVKSQKLKHIFIFLHTI